MGAPSDLRRTQRAAFLDCPYPDEEDQPARTPSGRLTPNGLFHEATERFKRREEVAEPVKVYQKLQAVQWLYNGLFRLTDSWQAPRKGAACGSSA
jgi:hypothetical protein